MFLGTVITTAIRVKQAMLVLKEYSSILTHHWPTKCHFPHHVMMLPCMAGWLFSIIIDRFSVKPFTNLTQMQNPTET